MNKKECIWKIFSLCIGIVVIVCAAFIIWQIKQTETLEPTSEKNINSNYFANPDRIVYKIKEENRYYVFEKNEQEYKEILQEFCKVVNSKTEGDKLSEKRIKEIKKNEMYVEFDYNKVSKNYIFPLELEGKNMIAMQDEGGQVYIPKIENTDKIKEIIKKNIEGKSSYRLEEPKVYTSENALKEVKEPEEMEKIDDNHYELKIDSYEYYTEFAKKYNVEIENVKIDDATFKYNNIIAIVSKYTINNVTSDVGSIQYYYTGKVDENTEYKVTITIVSKVTNANCIYRDFDKVEKVQQNDNTTTTSSEEAIEKRRVHED